MPYADKSKQRAAQLAWVRKKHAARRAALKCVQCGEPTEEYRCGRCKSAHTVLQRTYRDPSAVALPPITIPKGNRYMYLTDAALYIERTEKAVERLVERGKIPFSRREGRLVFDRLQLDGWKRRQVMPAQAAPVPPHAPIPNGYLDVAMAAVFLGRTEKVVRHMVDRNLVPFEKIGPRVMFNPTKLAEWKAGRVDSNLGE